MHDSVYLDIEPAARRRLDELARELSMHQIAPGVVEVISKRIDLAERLVNPAPARLDSKARSRGWSETKARRGMADQSRKGTERFAAAFRRAVAEIAEDGPVLIAIAEEGTPVDDLLAGEAVDASAFRDGLAALAVGRWIPVMVQP